MLLKIIKNKRAILILQKPKMHKARSMRIQLITILNTASALEPQRRNAIRLTRIQLMQQTRRSRINRPHNMQQQTTSHIPRKKRQNHRFLRIHLQTNLNRQSRSTPTNGITNTKYKKTASLKTCLNPTYRHKNPTYPKHNQSSKRIKNQKTYSRSYTIIKQSKNSNNQPAQTRLQHKPSHYFFIISFLWLTSDILSVFISMPP
jgi:hypothetical protein